MNYKYWRQHHSDAVFMAKLVEELGEAGRALQERDKALYASDPAKRGIKKRTAELAEELDHVEFIARCWRRQLDTEWTKL
jgi:NTP pyrophosphatase (non-canonical NTP hydrolase)